MYTKFKEENLIYDENTVMNNIPIPFSFEIKSINEKKNMEYLSNLITESFTGIEI